MRGTLQQAPETEKGRARAGSDAPRPRPRPRPLWPRERVLITSTKLQRVSSALPLPHHQNILPKPLPGTLHFFGRVGMPQLQFGASEI